MASARSPAQRAPIRELGALRAAQGSVVWGGVYLIFKIWFFFLINLKEVLIYAFIINIDNNYL
jgi:hypothetical protein